MRVVFSVVDSNARSFPLTLWIVRVTMHRGVPVAHRVERVTYSPDLVPYSPDLVPYSPDLVSSKK